MLPPDLHDWHWMVAPKRNRPETRVNNKYIDTSQRYAWYPLSSLNMAIDWRLGISQSHILLRWDHQWHQSQMSSWVRHQILCHELKWNARYRFTSLMSFKSNEDAQEQRNWPEGTLVVVEKSFFSLFRRSIFSESYGCITRDYEISSIPSSSLVVCWF